jgi:hypothetical protein
LDLFEIKLLEHYWINNSFDKYGDSDDVTSHGKIGIYLNNKDFVKCNASNTDYGINLAAVNLLQSIFFDRKYNLALPLINHGCSIFPDCPCGCNVDFSLFHNENETTLKDFWVNNEKQNLKDIQISRIDYANQIINFAENALDLLPEEKETDYDEDNQFYAALFNAHTSLINIAKSFEVKFHLTFI